jgi:hypothetical protein
MSDNKTNDKPDKLDRTSEKATIFFENDKETKRLMEKLEEFLNISNLNSDDRKLFHETLIEYAIHIQDETLRLTEDLSNRMYTTKQFLAH